MGFTPQQVGAMGYWEFMAAYSGYERAHGGGDEGEVLPAMTAERARELGVEGL